MRFEWEAEKDARNERIHGVSFEEAKELFTTDALVLEVYDVEHSESEDRYKSIGPIRGRARVGRLDGTVRRCDPHPQRLVGPPKQSSGCTKSLWRP